MPGFYARTALQPLGCQFEALPIFCNKMMHHSLWISVSWESRGAGSCLMQAGASQSSGAEPKEASTRDGQTQSPDLVSTVFQEGVCSPTRDQTQLTMGHLGKVSKIQPCNQTQLIMWQPGRPS